MVGHCTTLVRLGTAAALLTLNACVNVDDVTNPTPVKSVLLESAPPESLASTTLYFLTDRDTDPASRGGFDGQWSGGIACGTAAIDIPSNRPPGMTWGMWHTGPTTAAKSADFNPPDNNAVRPLACSDEAGIDAIARNIEQTAGSIGCDTVLIYVHGFNNTFRTAALKAAQLSHDTNFGCVTAAFSWTSAGIVKRYVEDAEIAGLAQPRLIALLGALANSKRIRHIDVVAHSMGTRVTLTVLAQLGRRPDMQGRRIIDELILAAPDIGIDVFSLLYAKASHLMGRTTVYVSHNDAALAASCDAHGGDPRAGESAAAIEGAPGLDVIDASNAPADVFGHGYFADSSPVVSDITQVLAGKSARDRVGPAPPALEPVNEHYKLRVEPGQGPSLFSRAAVWFFNCHAPQPKKKEEGVPVASL